MPAEELGVLKMHRAAVMCQHYAPPHTSGSHN